MKVRILILANSSLGTPVAANVAARIGASLQQTLLSFHLQAAFCCEEKYLHGKAFSLVTLSNTKKVITIRKNAAELKEVGVNVQVTALRCFNF
jgi:electron transfer flavoprotein alpha subunit